MTRELFIETIEALQKQDEHDSKCVEAFEVILNNSFVSNYDNRYLTNQLVKLLQVAMNDEGKGGQLSLIEYFLYDLDFGRKYNEKEHGITPYLSDAGKLWDYLNSNLEI